MKHRKNRFFYLLDLKDAYSNVSIKKLAQILCQQIDKRLANSENEVLEFLRKYCMSPRGGLAIGANASPDLFNAYCAFAIDLELGKLCKKWNIIYTRYLDDLTFSSLQPIGKRKRKAIRQLIESGGFKINHRKVKVYDLAKGPIVINGIRLRLGGKTFCPGHYKRKIKGLMNKALSSKEITPSMIHGRMGVFLSATDLRNLNQSEKDILKRYRIFRNLTGN